MRYRIRANLSYCLIGSHAVFLDIDADRYFLLSDRLERAFLGHANNTDPPDEQLQELVDLKILTLAPTEAAGPSCESSTPTRSATELPWQTKRPAVLHVPEVWADVWACRRMLKTQSLGDILDATAQYRETHLAQPTRRAHPQRKNQLLEYVNIFLRARLYIPTEPRCLLDSLALTRFLARRQHSGSIVFGATYEPFTAHCWVQIGDLVLNDTIGSVMSHTPIRVV